MSRVEVEVYALSDLNSALHRLMASSDEALAQAEQAIEDENGRLQQIVRQREAEVGRCKREYEICLSMRDDGGYSLPCTAEAEALAAAQAALAEACDCAKLFADQAQQFRDQAIKLQQSIRTTTEAARSYLAEHIEAGLAYLEAHPNEVGSVSGAGTHGSRYQKARREWFRRGADGELWGTEGRQLQGWMRQEVHRGGYYRSPPYYDTGHRLAGIDIPENFRWEDRDVNRLRPRVAQRYGVSRIRY